MYLIIDLQKNDIVFRKFLPEDVRFCIHYCILSNPSDAYMMPTTWAFSEAHLENSLLQRHLAHCNQTWHNTSLDDGQIQNSSNEQPFYFQGLR